MIVTTIKELPCFKEILSDNAEKIINFIENWKKNPQKPGKYEIDGEKLFAAVSIYETENAEKREFEAHKKYIDLQYVFSGAETLYWADLDSLCQTSESFSTGGDVAFYKGEAQSSVNLSGDVCAILLPKDAHKPNCIFDEKQEVTKIVFKIMA